MADKEVDLLSRVAINHLFLGQFEAFRAIILTLHRRDPSLAVSILHSAIINASGTLSTYLSRSTDSSSPALFSWLSVSLLIHLTNFQVTTAIIPCPDPDSLRIHAEFLLYIHLIKSRLSKVFDSGVDGGNIDKNISLRIWDRIADLGFVRLREDVLSVYHDKPEDGEGSERFFPPEERDLEWFKKAVLEGETADTFEALCWNIKNQVQQSDGFGSRLVILGKDDGNWSTNSSFEVFMHILRNGQMAHLDCMRKCLEEDHITEAVAHIRYLHLDYGLSESEYSSVLHILLKWVVSRRVDYGEEWQIMQELLFKIYIQALSSSCTALVQMIQRLHDDIISEEIEMLTSSSSDNIPPPIDRLNKYLDATKSNYSSELVRAVLHTCKRDLFHYCRVSGTHMLECVVDTALSAVKNEQLQEACNILMLFPQLRPLATVMGWDILSGKTEARKKLMQLLCTSMPQFIQKEEPSMHDDKLNRISCIEHLCDTLCYQLDIAAFVATVNSGQSWSFNHSLLLSKNQQALPNDLPRMDPFVENYVLERLSFQSPIRVLFDLVPSIKFQDVIKLIRMRPLDSTTEIRRIHDIELIHMRYALEYAVLALGAMEGSETDLKGMSRPIALCFLKDFQTHADEITNIPRRIFLVNIVISLLHMDFLVSNLQNWVLTGNSKHYFYSGEGAVPDDENKLVVSFTELLLGVLHHVLPLSISEQRSIFAKKLSMNGIRALKWRILYAKTFIEDWEWRLSVLQRLLPLSERQWKWREALAVLRAAPSTLLDVCMRKAKYDIGEEAVHRFSLPPEDKATLELAEWVDAAFSDEAIEDSFLNAADATSILNFDFVSLRAKLGHLAAIILCIDVAATSARSPIMSQQLLHQAQVMLSEIYPGGSQKTDSTYWEQVHEVGVISVARRILKCLLDTLEQESPVLQAVFIADSVVSSENKGRKDRTISLLHQMIDDAHKGKRQFLSGKLHNLSRAILDDGTDGNIIKWDHSVGGQKPFRNFENGLVFGLGLNAAVPDSSTSSIQENDLSSVSYDIKDDGRRLFGHLSSKPTTYLSQFILHIAAIGDTVDGTDTVHDFNFFSIIYEWPKNILTHLVFDRGSSDAAAKVAEIMSVDFVHEVISTCVPPMYPPKSEHGWASVPLIATCSRSNSENKVFLPSIKEAKPNIYMFSSSTPGAPLYPLQLDVVKHLAKLSPIRAVLACVFGSNILHQSNDLQIYGSLGDGLPQSGNVERSFYEFSLEQSERFPTLNRWIQMQTSLHQVSEFVVSSEKSANISELRSSDRVTIKRVRDNDTDNESEVDDNVVGGKVLLTVSEQRSRDVPPDLWKNHTTNDNKDNDSTAFLCFDWENEQIYEKAVQCLIDEGKLLDAIALSDRFLHNGASDHLLCLIMKQEEDHYYTPTQLRSHHDEAISSGSWKYCLRLKDKSLAAKLALEYLHHWNLTAALDVLMMCSCHLSNDDSIRNEIVQSRLALQRYQNILSADSNYRSWQEVEEHCKADPEGLALGLAGKGAVSVALEVCESALLSTDLRRELQGRQLVKLLTADPLSGGGPAEASRFLSSLGDSDDALPVAVSAMQLLPNLRSKQLLVHFFLKRRGGNLSDAEVSRLNLWALGLRVLAALPLPWQQRCSSLHEHPQRILEVLLMRKQLQSASMIMQEFPSLRDDDLLIIYAAKAIDSSFDSAREGRITLSAPRPKPKSRTVIPAKPSFTHSLSNLHREARKAFSWAPRNTGEKTAPKDVYRKRKSSGLGTSEGTIWEEMPAMQEDRNTSNIMEGQERIASIHISEEWMLTGDPIKDDGVRLSHRYESSPDISLFKEILSLCSDESTSAKGAIDLCVTEMKKVLSSQKLPENASVEAVGRAYHATEVFVQGLMYAKSILRRLAGYAEISSNSERTDGDDTSPDGGSQVTDETCDVILQAEFWLGRAELLQSLLGSGISACIDDISDKECSGRLRDRLIIDERYSMAVYTCKKCKIDSFPVWNSWGHALIQMERYAQARVKFKQALQLYKGEHACVILDIVGRIEGSPPVDVSAVRAMYEHLARRVPTISDDSLSTDSYLNVLHIPSTFPRLEYYRRFNDSENKSFVHDREFGDWHGSNLDSTRYQECVYYLQEYAPQHLMRFMFEHGHYKDACMLFFPQNSIPSPARPSAAAVVAPSSSPQRPDPLATDCGTLDDLCELCVTYGAIHVLEGVIMERISTQHDMTVIQHTSLSLSRICAYCETHKHFNHLYMFQVLSRDFVAAGLCCIQLFINSFLQDEAIRHLENAKTHFEEGLTTRYKTGDSSTKLVGKGIRARHASDKITEEELVKLSARISIQVEVVRAFNSADEPQWKFSLFGNPNDPETFRRRCKIGEVLVEKNFDLAFQVIYEFSLPAVHIYAAVAATLAERKRGGQLTEFFRNIKGTIDDDDWDQVVGAAINIYANKHKERPDRLIDMLKSSHRKVLACVVCGRLKTAFQIASRSGSVADVQYIAHQALHANSLSVLDMCKQWLARYI